MIDNVKEFNKNGVIDTCSLLNLSSTKTLDSAAKIDNCNFIISDFIEYELLYKERNIQDDLRRQRAEELDLVIKEKIRTGEIGKYDIELIDLLSPAFKNHNKSKSRGELTAIVLADKFNIAIITDDKKAQNVASATIGNDKVDSVCSLISYLYYHNKLSDSDKVKIITEQDYYFRNQELNFEKAYKHGLEERLINRQGTTNNT